MSDQLIFKFPTFKAYKKEDFYVSPSNQKAYDFIKKNVVLYRGIYFIGGKLIYLNKYKNRYLRQMYNIMVLRKYLFAKILTIETNKTNNKWISIFTAFNRIVFKGKRIRSLIFNRPFRMARNIIKYYHVVRENFEVKENIVKGYDFLLLSHTQKQYEIICYEKLITDAQIIQVGYTRGLREWQGFLDKNASRYLPKEIKVPYIVFSIDFFGKWLREADNVSFDEVFEESLNILKEFNGQIMTVFKPNQRADMNKAYKILNSVGYKNYIISNVHPVILLKEAKLFFACHPTSLLIEAFFHGCPTVEYENYDGRFLDCNKGQSVYLNCVDYFVHRDVEELKQVIDKLIHNDIHVQRDPNRIKKDFPVLAPPELKEIFSWLV